MDEQYDIIKFQKSDRKNKKYDVFIKDKMTNKIYKVSFGDSRYEQYEDLTPLKLYSHLDHKNKERRKKYLARASKIKDKKGNYTRDNILSPNFWSINFLW